MIKKILALGLGILVLSTGMAEARPASFDDLDGHSYVSKAIKGGKGKPKAVEISFTEGQDIWTNPIVDDSSVPILGVYSGCNSMSAKYRVTNGVVRWTSGVFTTLVGCVPNRDGWIARHLRKGMKAELKGKWLFLSRGTAVRIWLKPR